jgi:hypothetical protein
MTLLEILVLGGAAAFCVVLTVALWKGWLPWPER